MEAGVARIAEDGDFAALKELLDTERGWRLDYARGGTRVWTEAGAPAGGFKMLKVVAELPDVAPAVLYDVLHDPAYRAVWDSHMIAAEDVGYLNINNDVGYYAMSCPAPLKNRDFVLQRSWLDTGDEKMIINHSVFHNKYPQRKGFIRATSLLTGYVIRDLDKGGSCLGYVSRSDPRGQLPAWLVNKVTNIFAPKLVKKFHKAALAYPDWKDSQDNPGLKPWIYPEQVADVRISILDCVESESSVKTAPDKAETKSESTSFKFRRRLSKSKKDKEAD